MTADPDHIPTPPPAPPKAPSLPGRELPDDFALMSFGDHLEELRRRLIWSIVGIVPLFIVAFSFGRPIINILIEPARAQLRAGGQSTTLLATAPFETFGSVVHVAVILTVLVGSPWILYQLWLFVSPGLYASERKFFYRLGPLSTMLTASSIAFLYWVILPVILAFFIGFGSKIGAPDIHTAPLPEGVTLNSIPILASDPPASEIEAGAMWINSELLQLRVCLDIGADGVPTILGTEMTRGAGISQQYKISEYIRMLLNMGLAFGIGFQMPVVVLLLGWAGIVTRQTLAKYRRHAIGACALAGALLTPADPLSMVLLAIPLYLLFELGMLLLRVWPAGEPPVAAPDESAS